MATAQPRPKVRANSKYSNIERLVLDKYKRDYLACETKQTRRALFIESIGPDMKKKWIEMELLKEGDTNTFLKMSQVSGGALWFVGNSEVYRPLIDKAMDKLRATRPPVKGKKADMGLYSLAVKEVWNGLEEIEQQRVQGAIEDMKVAGRSEADRRRYAKDNILPRIESNSHALFLEFGGMPITFAGYITADGRVRTSMDDAASRVAGLTGFPSFAQSYPDTWNAMMVDYTAYVKKIKARRFPEENTEPGAEVLFNTSCIRVQGSAPRLPQNNLDGADADKNNMAHLVRDFVNEHYRKATLGRVTRAPYTHISRSPAEFLPPEARPTEFVLKNPYNMTRENLRSYLRLLYQLQDSPNAFRFIGVEEADGSVGPAKYDCDGIPETEATKGRRKGKKAVRTAEDDAREDEMAESGAKRAPAQADLMGVFAMNPPIEEANHALTHLLPTNLIFDGEMLRAPGDGDRTETAPSDENAETANAHPEVQHIIDPALLVGHENAPDARPAPGSDNGRKMRQPEEVQLEKEAAQFKVTSGTQRLEDIARQQALSSTRKM
ncbi:hypothetical protein ONZ45_g17697 [Pleurotus djamor]|nr:hypothetical protein ONZ45_g17697 [Pleurotus djamor]